MTFNIWKACKITVIFISCTCLFYFGLQAMHDEYERYHRYDQPEDRAVKVFKEQDRLVDKVFHFFN